jgi:hypothetical protein
MSTPSLSAAGFIESEESTDASPGANAMALVSASQTMLAQMQRQNQDLLDASRQQMLQQHNLMLENMQFKSGMFAPNFELMMASMIANIQTANMTAFSLETTKSAGGVSITNKTTHTFDPVGIAEQMVKLREVEVALRRTELEHLRLREEMVQNEGPWASMKRAFGINQDF